MSRRSEVAEVLRIMAGTDDCGSRAYVQYDECRNRSTCHEARQSGDRSRPVVSNAGQPGLFTNCRNEVAEVLRITGRTDGWDATASWSYVKRRNRSTSREARQIGGRSRQVVSNAG